MATGAYKLDLDPPKRNVFVTQLHNREDEEEELHQFPIVQESAGKLLESGINTLQTTLLLKKEVEVERMDDELQNKRGEFRARMEQCAERQLDIQKKQQRMKDRIAKFEKFIKENESKRRRAIQKYQTEVKLKEQKNSELDMFMAQLEELKQRQLYLKNKLACYKMYEDFLMKVIDILPSHYLEVNDSMLNSLMMRHRTLSATNTSLVDTLTSISDELETLKQEYEDMKQEHNKKKISINSLLSQMQKQQESAHDRNQEKEHKFGMGKVEFRTQMAEFGQIIMCINNLADKCHRKMDPPLSELSLIDRLEMIKAYMVERDEVIKIAGRQAAGSQTSEKHIASNKIRRK